MPARFGQHEAVTGSGLATRLKAGQNPATAWDDPAGAAYPGPGGVSGQAPANEEPSAGNGGLRRDPRQGQVTFYDREALREQIKALQNEKRDLSNTEVDLGLRLAKAQATLSAMRTKKCALSEEKILSEATSFVPARDKVGRRSENLWGRKYRDKTGDGARNRHEARDLKRQEETNVSNDALCKLLWCAVFIAIHYSGRVLSCAQQLGLLLVDTLGDGSGSPPPRLLLLLPSHHDSKCRKNVLNSQRI